MSNSLTHSLSSASLIVPDMDLESLNLIF